jgi:hypothetical protein
MGMFDSFYVRGVEVQTKALDNNLSSFQLGDTVPNYEGNFDGPTGTYYLIEDSWPTKEWYGLIIIDNIFIDAVKSQTEEEVKRITTTTFATLKERPEFVAQLLTAIVKTELNPKLKLAELKLKRIRSIIYDYKQSLEPDTDNRIRMFSSLHPKIDEFRKGAKLEVFINEILEGKFLNNNEEYE